MARIKRLHISLFALLLIGAAVACGPSDPKQKLLQERTRWSVDLLAWSQTDDGGYVVSTRVSGPVHSELPKLTVRIDLVDAKGDSIQKVWHTFDLSGFQRGGSQEIMLRLPAQDGVVDGMSIDTVPAPTPEQEPHIEELRL